MYFESEEKAKAAILACAEFLRKEFPSDEFEPTEVRPSPDGTYVEFGTASDIDAGEPTYSFSYVRIPAMPGAFLILETELLEGATRALDDDALSDYGIETD